MHCKACDVILQEHELGRKGASTGEFIDLCDPCFDTIKDDIAVVPADEFNEDELGLEELDLLDE